MSEHHIPYSRRMFMRQGMALASLTATIPQFIHNSALGMVAQLAGNPGGSGVPQDRILVVVQLGGGNDGLNTVIPFGMSEYYNARPTIAIAAPNGTPQGQTGAALMLDQQRGLGLNPSLKGLKGLFDDGKLAVLQGVGYPNPNRSHFTSMDIWQTANTGAKGNGWIGRYFDNTCNGTPIPEGSISIGRTAPLAMNGQVQKPISFESAQLFRWLGKDLHKSLDDPYQRINRAGILSETDPSSQAAFLMRTSLDAQLGSDRIRAAVAKSPLTAWPNSEIAEQLRTVSALIRDGMPTRVYYVSQGGYDTHGGQLASHGRALQQVGDALAAFQKELNAQSAEDRVITMVFSEFGRRVKQNASGGTDHGTAAPMFVIGSKVKAGVHGSHPSLTDLDDGDLKFKQDFRGVYANILDDWLHAPGSKILGGSYAKPSIIKA